MNSTPTGLVWYTNMATVSLFWDNNMAAVTSCENTLFLTMLWYSRISWNISFLPNLAASVRGVSPKLFLMNVSPRILCLLCVAWKNMSYNERMLDQYNKIVLLTFDSDFFPHGIWPDCILYRSVKAIPPSFKEVIWHCISFHVCTSFNVKERKKERKIAT